MATKSLLIQTLPADEIVVVEDGPLTPSQLAVLEQLQADAHSRVIRVRLEVNGGAGVANAAGLHAASGTWIAKADADDINLAPRFETQLAFVRECGLDVCGAAMAEFDVDPRHIMGIRTTPASHQAIARRMRMNNPINHPTAFFRRQLAVDVGGYPAMRYMQDYDLFARMLAGGARMGNTDEVLVKFRADAAMMKRRGGRHYGRLERELQRNLRRYGLVGPIAAARNRVVRGAFRALPPAAVKVVYAKVFRERVATGVEDGGRGAESSPSPRSERGAVGMKRARKVLARGVAPLRRATFKGSGSYWTSRYEAQGTSGTGSYGPLAEFKARVLNDFVAEHDITSVMEFGCGDGNQLRLASYPRYMGLDVAPGAIELCLEKFAGDQTKSFILYSTKHFRDPLRILRADLAVSLDVIFHLVEDEVYEAYMTQLFAAADRFVIVYSSDSNLPDSAPHVKHRNFTEWVERNIAGWSLVQIIENPYRGSLEGAVSDFHIYGRP